MSGEILVAIVMGGIALFVIGVDLLMKLIGKEPPKGEGDERQISAE